MKRNDDIDFMEDANGAGRDGFTDGDPGAIPVVNASEVVEVWLNAVQEEICRAIELLGGTLSGADVEQLGTLLLAFKTTTNARLASDHFVYATPKTRTVFVPATAFAPQVSGGWVYAGLGWISAANSAILDGDLTPYIPAGATVTKITSVYNSGSIQLAAVSVQHRLSKYAFAVVGNLGTNVVPWSVTSTTGWVLGFGDDSFTQSVDVNAPTGCNPLNAIDTKANALLLEVKASDDGAASPDIFYGLTISLTNDTYASNY